MRLLGMEEQRAHKYAGMWSDYLSTSKACQSLIVYTCILRLLQPKSKNNLIYQCQLMDIVHYKIQLNSELKIVLFIPKLTKTTNFKIMFFKI